MSRDPDTAVILPPTAASFQTIAGLPLIQRTVLSAQRSGFARVLVVDAAAAPQLRALLHSDPRTRTVETLSDTSDESLGNGRIALIPSDCVVTSGTLQRMRAAPLNGRPLVCGNPRGSDRVVIGHAAALAEVVSRWPGLRAADLEVAGDPADVCVRVRDAASARDAEISLFHELRAATAASDGPLARRFDRSISQWLSRRLVTTALRPNHITVISTTVGLLGAWGVAAGTYGLGVLGTLLFLCATILDGCDGEIARLKFQESRFGHYFDVATDNVVHVAIFIGLVVGQYQRHPATNYVGLIGLLLGGVACGAAAAYWCFIHQPRRTEAPRSQHGRIRERLLDGFEALMNRDFAYLLLLLAVVDRLQWFVWGAALGSYLFAVLLLAVYQWRPLR